MSSTSQDPLDSELGRPLPRLVWSSTGDLNSPKHSHDDVLCMLRPDSCDVRVNTLRYPRLEPGLDDHQKTQIKEEIERQIRAAFPGEEHLPVVSFPSGQWQDDRMIDIYCSRYGQVTLDDLERAAMSIKFTQNGYPSALVFGCAGTVIERNEQLLRIKDLPVEHLDNFIKDGELLLRSALPAEADIQIKDIWALHYPGQDKSFSGTVDVLIELPDETDAVAAAYHWPGWFFWEAKDKLLELEYRNRFKYCCQCKGPRHLCEECVVAPCSGCRSAVEKLWEACARGEAEEEEGWNYDLEDEYWP